MFNSSTPLDQRTTPQHLLSSCSAINSRCHRWCCQWHGHFKAVAGRPIDEQPYKLIRGSWAFRRAFICHLWIRIVVVVAWLWWSFHGQVGGGDRNYQKEEPFSGLLCSALPGSWTQLSHQFVGVIVWPLIWWRDIWTGCPAQANPEMHRCANVVASLPTLRISPTNETSATRMGYLARFPLMPRRLMTSRLRSRVVAPASF